MARKVSHELAAKATARTQSSSSAARETPRSRRVSRSRSKGTEVASTETSSRGVEVWLISLGAERCLRFGGGSGRTTLPEDYGGKPSWQQPKRKGIIAK